LIATWLLSGGRNRAVVEVSTPAHRPPLMSERLAKAVRWPLRAWRRSRRPDPSPAAAGAGIRQRPGQRASPQTARTRGSGPHGPPPVSPASRICSPISAGAGVDGNQARWGRGDSPGSAGNALTGGGPPLVTELAKIFIQRPKGAPGARQRCSQVVIAAGWPALIAAVMDGGQAVAEPDVLLRPHGRGRPSGLHGGAANALRSFLVLRKGCAQQDQAVRAYRAP